MSRKNLLEYFGLINLDNTQFGNTFFNTFKSVKDSGPNSTNFLEFEKFATAISMLGANNQDDRIKFMF